MAEEEKGPRATRYQTYSKYTDGLGKGSRYRNNTGKSIYLCKTKKNKTQRKQKTVMKGDFDSPAKLEIF